MPSYSNYTSVFRVRLGDDRAVSGSDATNSGGGHAFGSSNTSGGRGHHDSNGAVTSATGAGGAASTTGPPIRRSHPPRAKARPVVSCHLCRLRKQKCDRLLPCGTCQRRGDSALCRYGGDGGVSGTGAGVGSTAANAGSGNAGGNNGSGSSGSGTTGRKSSLAAARPGTAGASSSSPAAAGVRQEAQMRLQRLEELVNGLVARSGGGGSGSGNAASSEKPDAESRGTGAAARGPGAMTAPQQSGSAAGRPTPAEDGSDRRFEWIMPMGPAAPSVAVGPVATMIGETPFAGATNWAAVLDSIRDIQSYLGELGEREAGGRKEGDGDGEPEEEEMAEAQQDDVARSAQGAARAASKTGPKFTRDPKDAQWSWPLPNLETSRPVPSAAAAAAAVTETATATATPDHTTPPPLHRLLPPPPPLPPSFQPAEADSIFASVTTTPGLVGSSNSNPPASSFAALPQGKVAMMPQYLADAIAELPQRVDCDRLLGAYFQSSYMTGPFVHMYQFQRAYTRFWNTGNPSAAHAVSPLLWVSMLASILSMGAMITGGRQLAWSMESNPAAPPAGPFLSASERTTSTTATGSANGNANGGIDTGADRCDEPEITNDDLKLATRLRRLSTRCLLAGDYMSGRPLAVEALLLNAHTRLVQKRDVDPAAWATFGMVVRLAQRMGYQQVDAPGSRHSLLSPFEKELRRRVWYFVESFDMLYSFQFGMPTIVHEEETATDPPNNLRDDDFDETTSVLPPSRPPTDYTPALYFSVKLGRIRLLRKVLRFAVWRVDLDLQNRQPLKGLPSLPLSEEDRRTTNTLWAELREAYAAVPPRLRMPTHIRDCPFSDQSHDIMHRIAIELMHHKAVCILFRQSLSRSTCGPDDLSSGCGFSVEERAAQRQACLVSALRILDLHTEFENETRPAEGTGDVHTRMGPEAAGKNVNYLAGYATGGHGSGGSGGRLASDRYMLSSLALHDFLLAATILCLDLIELQGQAGQGGGGGGTARTTSSSPAISHPPKYPSPENQHQQHHHHHHHSHQRQPPSSSPATTSPPPTSTAAAAATISPPMPPYDNHLKPFFGSGEPTLEARAADRGAKLAALRTAYALWHKRRLTSRDAAHAARILGAIVTKLSVEGPVGGGEEVDGPSPATESSSRDTTSRTGGGGSAASQADTQTNATMSDNTQDNTPASQDNAFLNPSYSHSGAAISGMASAPASAPAPPPPPPHLNYAYDWAEPGPFDAVLNDPMNVDWNMVDSFLLDRQLDIEVGGNVWSADLMALES